MDKKILLGLVIGGIILAGVSFYAGDKYGSSKAPSFNRQFNGGTMGNFGGARGSRGGNAPVMGQVISHDSNTLTVKLRDGGSKLVLLATSTEINKSTTGSVADLTPGQEVTVIGSANSDGSVNGQIIQVR